VLKLHKALYGLKQAPRAWNSMLDSVLHDIGFTKCKSEYGLYTRIKDQGSLIVGVYVDDLIIMGEQFSELIQFQEEMKKVFRMSDLGALSYYLGIEVRQGSRGMELCQRSYATKLLEKAGLSDCNSCTTPMEPKLKLSKDSKSPVVDATEYRSLIGSLRYLLHTRPEITYLSWFTEDPRQEHMEPI
jgi:hypothetical protein